MFQMQGKLHHPVTLLKRHLGYNFKIFIVEPRKAIVGLDQILVFFNITLKGINPHGFIQN